MLGVLPASKAPPRVSPSRGTRIAPAPPQLSPREIKGGAGAFQLITSSWKPLGCLFHWKKGLGWVGP